ncbi:MAG: PEP-CTERM sorting domain-containing protein [Planctomycetaceae bacterium]|jgi:hypothetical protein|nr:PEP-CTERM sorting domain-containing protein [Planctomycetaceae bacterium]
MTTSKKLLLIPMFIITVTFAAFRSVQADMLSGSLGAADIVNAFNSMNGGTGAHFWTSGTTGISYDVISDLRREPGMDLANIDAYKYPRADTDKWGQWFRTFCIEPSVQSHGGNLSAKLDYRDGKSVSQNNGNVLTVGAAYLYAMFATYNDAFRTNLNTLDALTDFGRSLRFLMGEQLTGAETSWNSNAFLQAMLSLNSMDYWTAEYNPDAYYTEIGNFSIFVMNVTSDKYGQSQNFLFAAKAANPYDSNSATPGASAPEPATMALFGLGLAGLAVLRRRKR